MAARKGKTKKRRSSPPRRKSRRPSTALRPWLLLLGATLTCVAVGLPWVEIDPERYGILEDALSGLGIIPDGGEVVRGCEIPNAVREAARTPGLTVWFVVDDLTSGRWDRATARALFGERIEEKWAPVVFLPTLLALAHLGLLRRRPQPMLAAWLFLADLLTLMILASGIFLAWTPVDGVGLNLHEGVGITVLGTAVLASGAWWTAQIPRTRK